ncbi:hypothetical protein [uncultured Gilvimarinus sp.]|uniref:alpha-glutamyl/putrescinyl thymine pyrophosphorylase clade 3 protein n=1 Tax=uncultured Gilvimarinus sp. TaxID=1689143 RepID=UPI0030D82740
MNNEDRMTYSILAEELSNINLDITILNDLSVKEALVMQIIDSIRRVKYAIKIKNKGTISTATATPNSGCFDPIRAAVVHDRNGNVDEAVWLIFLSIHFGYSSKCKWKLVEDFYSGIGGSNHWSWSSIISKRGEFEEWLKGFHGQIANLSPRRKFGNHRKYESLKETSSRPLTKIIGSYRDLIIAHGDHEGVFNNARSFGQGDKYITFDYLYNYFRGVLSFGRTATFDFLCMIGKLGLVDVEPPRAYIQESTGPKAGARLLFGNAKENASSLEKKLMIMNKSLSIGPYGMQILEDAICNWQKNPNKYIQFRG